MPFVLGYIAQRLTDKGPEKYPVQLEWTFADPVSYFRYDWLKSYTFNATMTLTIVGPCLAWMMMMLDQLPAESNPLHGRPIVDISSWIKTTYFRMLRAPQEIRATLSHPGFRTCKGYPKGVVLHNSTYADLNDLYYGLYLAVFKELSEDPQPRMCDIMARLRDNTRLHYAKVSPWEL